MFEVKLEVAVRVPTVPFAAMSVLTNAVVVVEFVPVALNHESVPFVSAKDKPFSFMEVF